MSRPHPSSSGFARNQKEKGSSLLLVLVLLTVCLYGALAMARATESSTLLSGNLTLKDGALEAAEVGTSEAFAQLKALGSLDSAQGGWYFSNHQLETSSGVPVDAAWAAAPSLSVGSYTVKYVVERMCDGAVPAAVLSQSCVVEQLQQVGSAKAGNESLDAPTAAQYRISVAVTGPKSVKAYTQTTVIR